MRLTTALCNRKEKSQVEITKADEENTAYLDDAKNNIDENSVVLLSGKDIDTGKQIFSHKCVACHGSSGGSASGAAGPNLTDDYWIHGGRLKDIFISIKYGWTDKGMISWKDQLSPIQIAQVASYIKSIKGTKPANAKEPQGIIDKEEASLKNIVDLSHRK